ncbi:MAG TPA: putative Ig domain-containing protein [Myxococcota bacterium]|nr:putative Ig domain-containing protein [Myxococcota bacterium]
MSPRSLWTAVLALCVACGDDKSSVQDTACDDTQDTCQNGAPTLAPIPEQALTVDRPWTFTAEADDPDGDPLSFTLEGAPEGLTVDEMGLLSWTPDTTGTFDLTLTVSDPGGLTASQPVRLVVALAPPTNRPPTLSPIADQTVEAGDPLTLQLDATDPDGDALSFTLTPRDGLTVSATGLVTWTPPSSARGDNELTATVTDASGLSASQTFTVTVTVNQPPVLAAITDLETRAGLPVALVLSASDPDPGDTLTFQLDSGPRGASLDRNGRFFWVPTADQLGPHTVDLTVRDRRGLTDTGSFTLTVTAAKNRPDLAPIPDQRVAPNTPLELPLAVTDLDPDDISIFEITLGPPFVGVSEDGTFGALPTDNDLGRHDIIVTVTDGFGLSDSEAFILTVADPNAAPSATHDRYIAPLGQTTTIAAPGALVNDTDPDGDTLTATLVAPPSYGTVDLRPDGSFDYRPGAPVDEPITPSLRHRFSIHPTLNRPFYVGSGMVVGDLEGDGTTELVARGSLSSGFGNLNWIIALRANKATGIMEPVWTNHTWGNGNPRGIDDDLDYSFTQPVLADLDQDGTLEIIYGSVNSGEVVIFDHLGQVEYGPLADSPGLVRDERVGWVDAANLDGDDDLEIINLDNVGGANVLTVRDHTAAIVWRQPLTERVVDPDTGSPVVVLDLDLDLRPEIIVARDVWNADGTLRFTAPARSESLGTLWYVAAANFDEDPFGEYILFNSSRGVELREHDGSCIWRARATAFANDDCPLRVANVAGRPAELIVADFDDDGRPEILLADTNDRVSMLEHDGALKWQRTDITAGEVPLTGLTILAFDLNRDGILELIVGGADKGTAAVSGGVAFLDSRTGASQASIVGDLVNPVRGVTPAMLIADIDQDDAADLIIGDKIGFNSANSPTGIFVYGSATTPWAPARRAWSGWGDFLTNTHPSGGVLTEPRINWLTSGLNNFRANVPLLEEVGGSDRFTYVAMDGELTSNEATVHLELRRPNEPPVFLGRPKTVVGAGLTYRERLFVTDPDAGDTVTLSLNRGPAGLELNDNTLVWQTTELDLGEHPVLVSARDTEGAITTLELTLRVVTPSPVPDVVGLTREAAEDALDDADFTLGRVASRFDLTTPAGLVLDQTPVAGALATPGEAIAVTLSLGPAPGDQDNDLDTFTPNRGDCDDTNADIHPGASDPVDAIDQDCDGKDGSETPVSIAIEPDTADLLTLEYLDFRAIGIFADGSAQDLTHAATWSTANLTGASITNARFNSSAAGAATVTATFHGVSQSAAVTVHARAAADNAPIAFVTRPTEGATLTAPTPIFGTVTDPTLIRWELDLAEAGTETAVWTRVATGSEPVTSDTLTTLDTTTLVNGAYELRLTALNAAGLRTTDTLTVVVDGDIKVGLFSLAFEDLRVDLANIPITATRTYDSRDKRIGDFGVGWSLALSSVALRCTPNLGEGWFSAKSGLAFVLLGARAHTCSVTLPGGAVETFDLSPNPSTSVLVPFITATARFTPRGSARGSLTVDGNPFILITDAQPGPVVLLDDTTFAAFDPHRFRYTTADGTVFRFEDGALTTVTEKAGTSLTVTATDITHSLGTGAPPVVVSMVRDTLGRITSITGPDGATTRYAYNQSGDLVAHTDPLGNTTRLFYDRDHGLIRIEDPLGRPVVRSEYDERGRLVATTDALGHRTTYAHDDEARTLTTTFPDGSIRVVSYDEVGLVTSRVAGVTIDGELVPAEEQLSYDDQGNITRRVDPDGRVTETSYSGEDVTEEVIDPGGLHLVERQAVANDRVLSQTDASGRTTTFGYDARGATNLATLPGGATMRVLRDGAGRITQITEPTGERREMVYAGAFGVGELRHIGRDGVVGLVETTTYDAAGRPLSLTQTSTENGGATTRERVTTWDYDSTGRLTRTVDPEGHVTTYTYDAAGQLLTVVDASGTTAMTYDAAGRMLTRTHKDGGIERFAYDYAGRLTSHTDPDGVVTTHTYDELGRLVETREGGELVVAYTLTPGGRVAAVHTPDGVTEHVYDGAGRIIETRLPAVLTPDGETRRPTYTYELDPSGRELAVVDPNGLRTETYYDDAGRTLRKVHPDESELSYAWDTAGRLLSSTDELGFTTTFGYDALGRLSTIEEPEVDGLRPTTRLVHDDFGELRQRIDALGRTTTFTYDRLGREVSRARPDGLTQRRDYDERGFLVRRVDFDGTEVSHSYDAMGRLVARTTGALTETFTFSPAGRLTGFTDTRGPTTFEYDTRGRLSAQVDPDGVELGYGYDAMGRVTLLDVQGELTRYTYDAAGRMTRVVTPEGTFDYTLDLGGRIDSIAMPNGVTTRMIFDARNRPLDVIHSRSATELARYSSTFSPRGQRLTASDGTTTETYTYDPLGRLASVTRAGDSPYAATLAYDAVGNRTAMTVDGVTTSHAYGTNHELLSETTAGETTTFSYDLRGNRVSTTRASSTRTFTWDALNRLVGVSDGAASSTTWGYAPDGLRVTRTDGDTTEHLLVDRRNTSGFSQVVASHTPDGELNTAWRFGHDGLAQAGGTTRFYGTDGGGHVRALTDTSGAITDRYDYLPHGAVHTRTGTSDNPRLARGERFDAGLYDLRARPYDPATGVFLGRDPFDGFIDQPYSHQPYQYADGDPVGGRDPLGLFTLPEVSITMNIDTGLKGLNFGSSKAALCSADATLTAFQYMVRAVDVAIWLWNLHDKGAVLKTRHLKKEFKLPKEAKLELQLTPFILEGSLGTDFSVKYKHISKEFGVNIKRHKGKWSPTNVSGALMADLGICGFTVAQVGLALEHKFETGKGGLYLAVRMAKDSKDHVESGGFKGLILGWE